MFDDNTELFPDGKLYRILYDNITRKMQVICRDAYDRRKLVDEFSDENPAHFFTRQYGMATHERIYAVNEYGYFRPGLVFDVLRYIKEHHGNLTCVAISRDVLEYINTNLKPLKDFVSGLDREKFEVSNISSKIGLRDYQTAIIKSIIFDGYGRGLFEAPTGSGKSFTIANYIYTLQKQYDPSLRFLIFVPNSQLVSQFRDDLIDYGFGREDIFLMTGSLSAKEKKLQSKDKARIVIANRQYMIGHAKELPKIDVLIADEVHTLSSSGSKCVDFVSNLGCRFMVGCSGTIPRDKMNRYNLIGLFSRILYTEDIVNLQSQGYLSELEIKLVDITDRFVQQHRELLFHTNPMYRFHDDGELAFNDAFFAEKEYIDANYIKLFQPILEEMRKCNGNILVLFDRLEFGKNIYDYLLDNRGDEFENYSIEYADGATKVEKREEIRARFESSSNNILFAEVVIMGTGINIRNLPNIVFMFSGKSMTRVIQSIGRSLRTHKDKDKSLLIDSHFNFKYSLKHYKERKKLYKEFYGKDGPDKIVQVEV